MDDKINVFIVEDEALIADEIRRALVGLGYEVCAIRHDFASAEADIRHSDADLFILDINLGGKPGEDGIALARLIRTAVAKPFVFLTAYGDKSTIAKAAAECPANYLIKPVNPAALFAAIQLAIARVAEPRVALDAEMQDAPEFFYIKIGSRKEKLFWQDVCAIEASKNYAKLSVKGLPGGYPVRGTVAFVLDQLVPERLRERFLRLGRGIYINRTQITAVEKGMITCGGKTFENTGKFTLEQLMSANSQ